MGLYNKLRYKLKSEKALCRDILMAFVDTDNEIRKPNRVWTLIETESGDDFEFKVTYNGSQVFHITNKNGEFNIESNENLLRETWFFLGVNV